MKPSSKKRSKKKKKPAPAPAPEAASATPAVGAAAVDSSGEPGSPRSETLTLAAAAVAVAAAASETESSSSCEASTCTSVFTASSSGTASTSSFSASSSSGSTASSLATGDERRDLAWLLDAFASATIDQVDSAYREAGGDAFLAAGILGSTQDTQPSPPRPQPPPPPDLSPRAGSGGRKAGRRPKKVACAATGMVADVIGKDYTRPATSPVTVPNEWKGRDGLGTNIEWKGRDGENHGGCSGRNYNGEEVEQFLCSMLGDSELGMGVVRDVLGQCGYGVEKALDALLDISGVSSGQNIEKCYTNDERNSTLYPSIFPGAGLTMGSLAAGNKQSQFQLTDEMSSMTLQSQLEHEYLWSEPPIRAMVNDGASSSTKESSVTLQYPLLTRSNYTAWEIRMKACLKAQGVWEAIDTEKGADTRQDQMAFAAIYQGIPEETLLLLAEKETSREAWQMLKTMHMGVERVMEAKVQTLKSELDVLRMKEGDSIDDFAMKLTSIVSKIRALGEKVEETYVVKKLLRVVPKKFLQVVSTIEQFGDFKTMTVEEVIGRLKAYEERISIYAGGEGEHLLLTRAKWRAKESKGSKRNRKFDRAKVKCYNCQNYGHFSYECHPKKEEKALLVEKQEDDEPALLMAEAYLL